MTGKRCTGCGEVKPLSEFHRQGRNQDGRRSRCKACTSIRTQERRIRDNEKQNARRAEARRSTETKAFLISCPDDPVVGIPLYRPGTIFTRREFRGTVCDGSFPTGSVWRFASRVGQPATDWRVDGTVLREVGGLRVLRWDPKEVMR